MVPALKDFFFKHKNNKLRYYLISYARHFIPSKIFHSSLKAKMSYADDFDSEYLKRRVNYYNKLEHAVSLSDYAITLENFKLSNKNKTYFFDSYEYTRYFNRKFRICYKFGDLTDVPAEPSLVKSRPILGNNENSVLLNLHKIRHFTFVNDRKDFTKKKNMLVGRNFADQEHRIRFLKMYKNHPLCNVGKINKTGGYPDLYKPKLSIHDHLNYKFILCLEGNDVASNLKWVMSSHSLAVMPSPKYETWFMEGTLVADYHYVLIKDDYSDLEARLNYYIENTEKALEIIKNANQYVKQFQNKEREDLISLTVLEKYFYRTGQQGIT
jgi:hypothetical protein